LKKVLTGLVISGLMGAFNRTTKPTNTTTMKYKTTKYKNFSISGGCRNRVSYVDSLTETEYGKPKIIFQIEREQDYFLSHKTGYSYFVTSYVPRQGNFVAESWGEVIAKLNEIIA